MPQKSNHNSQQSFEAKKIAIFPEIVTQLAILFTTYSLVTVILFLHFRSWDALILKQSLGIFVYPLLVFSSVAFSFQYYRNSLWTLPITLLIVMGLPFGIAWTGDWVLIPLTLLGLGGISWASYKLKIHKQPKTLIQILSIGVILALIYFFVVNGYGYANVFSDILPYFDLQHKDTLFHSAIINMLAQFNTPSTGLDGVQPIVYHVGVHRWVAANSVVLGGDTSLLLAISQQVAFLPIFLFSATFVVGLLTSTPSSGLIITTSTLLTFWLISIYTWDSYLASESYAFSLGLFLAMIPIGKSWLISAYQSNKILVITPWEGTLTIAIIIACWAAKISSGFILIIYLMACVLSPKFVQNPQKFLLPITFIASLGFFGALGYAKWNFLNSSLFQVDFFHFAQNYTSQFIWVNIIFAITLAILALLFLSDKSTNKSFWVSILLVLLITFIAGQMPGLLLAIGGGSAYYFSHPALLISLCYGIAACIDYWSFKSQKIDWLPSQSLLSLGCLVLALVILSQVFPVRRSTVYVDRAYSFIFSSSEILNKFSLIEEEGDLLSPSDFSQPSDITRKQRLELLIHPPAVSSDLLSPQFNLVQIQKAVSDLDISVKDKGTIIYIPPSFEDFWQAKRCWAKPLVVPAVIGLPLLNGLRSGLETCPGTIYYGMSDYDNISLNKPMSDTEICKRTNQLGFRRILEISEDRSYLHSCNSNSLD